jgi:hypothetical protein
MCSCHGLAQPKEPKEKRPPSPRRPRRDKAAEEEWMLEGLVKILQKLNANHQSTTGDPMLDGLIETLTKINNYVRHDTRRMGAKDRTELNYEPIHTAQSG